MEILTNLQIEILKIVSNLPDKEEFIEKAGRKDPGFDLYWLGVAMERINNFSDDSPDMHLLTSQCTMKELKEFFGQWRRDIINEIKTEE